MSQSGSACRAGQGLTRRAACRAACLQIQIDRASLGAMSSVVPQVDSSPLLHQHASGRPAQGSQAPLVMACTPATCPAQSHVKPWQVHAPGASLAAADAGVAPQLVTKISQQMEVRQQPTDDTDPDFPANDAVEEPTQELGARVPDALGRGKVSWWAARLCLKRWLPGCASCIA